MLILKRDERHGLDGRLRYQSVKFSVVLDGKSVFTSNNPSEYDQKLVPINIMIPEGTKRMELIVDPCGDNVADHAVWAYPYPYLSR